MVEKKIRSWIEDFIIGLNLCPFAKKPWQLGQVKIRVVESSNEEDLTRALLEELSVLVEVKPSEVETTLLAHPNLLADFDDFLAYHEWTAEILQKSGVEGLIQIVGFHPDYYFDGVDQNDQGNYTNRSPYPMLHLIREQSVEAVAANYPDIEQIPARNVALLQEMTLADLKKHVYAKNDPT